MKTIPTLLAGALLLATLAAQADDPNSLQNRKLGVTKGTAPGITLIEGPRRGPEAATPAASGVAAGQAGAATAAAPGVAQTQARAPLVFELKPPSGMPITSIKRLEGPNVGIPLPTTDGTPSEKPRQPEAR